MEVNERIENNKTYRIGSKEMSAAQVLNLELNFGKTFKTIAIFSLINSVLNFFEAGIIFPIGLAVSQIVDAILMAFKAEAVDSTILLIASVACLGLNLIFSGIFFAFYKFSAVERRYIHIIGILVYLADTGLCLLFKDYVTAAFHGFFLIMLWSEFSNAPVILEVKNSTRITHSNPATAGTSQIGIPPIPGVQEKGDSQ